MSHLTDFDDEESLAPRKSIQDDARFDITAMIDLVFMMNIYFLVTTVTAATMEIDLPTAKHCVATDPETATILTLIGNKDPSSFQVTISSSASGQPLTEREEQEREIRSAVENGVQDGKYTVLIKAERSVRLRDVARIASIATAVPKAELKVAVLEKE